MQYTSTKGAKTDVRQDLQVLGLNDRQWTFVSNFLDGKSFQAASDCAGYSVSSAKALLRSAKVQQAMALILDRFLVGELAPSAIHTISKLLNDAATPAGVKANLALGVLDRSGFSAKRFEKADGSLKDTSAMSAPELQAEIDRLSREIEAKMVDVTPVSEPLTDEDLELYA